MRSFMNLTISRLTGVSAEYEKDLPFLPKKKIPPKKSVCHESSTKYPLNKRTYPQKYRLIHRKL